MPIIFQIVFFLLQTFHNGRLSLSVSLSLSLYSLLHISITLKYFRRVILILIRLLIKSIDCSRQEIETSFYVIYNFMIELKTTDNIKF